MNKRLKLNDSNNLEAFRSEMFFDIDNDKLTRQNELHNDELIRQNELHNESHTINCLIPVILIHSILRCLHCREKNFCHHITAHDYLLFSKMNRVCKVWRNIIQKWLVENHHTLQVNESFLIDASVVGIW